MSDRITIYFVAQLTGAGIGERPDPLHVSRSHHEDTKGHEEGQGAIICVLRRHIVVNVNYWEPVDITKLFPFSFAFLRVHSLSFVFLRVPSCSFVFLRDLKGHSGLTPGYSCLRGEK